MPKSSGHLTADTTGAVLPRLEGWRYTGSHRFPALFQADGVTESAELSSAISDGVVLAGDSIEWLAYYEGSDFGGGRGTLVPAATGTADGGLFIDYAGIQIRQTFGAELDVTQFGAVPPSAGVTSSPDLGAAVAAAAALASDVDRKRITIPAGEWTWSTPVTVTRPIRIDGGGKQQTVIFVSDGVTALTIDDVYTLASWVPSTTSFDTSLDNAGFMLTEVTFAGNNGGSSRAVRYLNRNDNGGLQGVQFRNLDQALLIGDTDALGISWMRQAQFYDLSVFRCGSATQPAIMITNAGATNDATNQVTFDGLELSFLSGVAMRIENPESGAVVRRITLSNLHLHGQELASGGADLLQLAGNVHSIRLYDARINAVDDGFAGVRLSALAGEQPKRIYIEADVEGTASGLADGILVESVQDLTVDGTATQGTFLRFSPNSVAGDAFIKSVPAASASVAIDDTVQDSVWGWVSKDEFRIPPPMFSPGSSAGNRAWVRLFTVDGQTNTSGGYCQALLTGTGRFGGSQRAMLFIAAHERGGNFTVDTWGFGTSATIDPVDIYTQTTADANTFEVWANLAEFNQDHSFQVLSGVNYVINVDNIGTTAPASPVQVVVADVARTAGPFTITGDGTTTTFNVSHNLDVAVPSAYSIMEDATGALMPALGPAVSVVDNNTLSFEFATAPAAAATYSVKVTA